MKARSAIITILCFLCFTTMAQITPGGVLDNVYDRTGHAYNLQDLAIDDVVRAAGGTPFTTLYLPYPQAISNCTWNQAAEWRIAPTLCM